MPCYTPIPAWIAHGKTEAGKQVIQFTKPSKVYSTIEVPCGQCIGCKLQRSITWATRCVHESSLHEANCFITLTYNEKHIPNDRSLNKAHFQKFLKRLRKYIYPAKLRYFMAGEYTDEWRPHYHAIIFGYDFPDKIRVQSKEVENPYFISPILSKLWDKGFHIIAETNFETAAYVARYCTKKITGEQAEEHYNRKIIDWNEVTGEINYMADVSLEPEYATMSRRPGIGKLWYDKYKKDCYPSDFLVHEGRKIPVPKYYDKLLESENELKLLSTKFRRKLKAMENATETTTERLRQREQCKLKQAETLKRNKV